MRLALVGWLADSGVGRELIDALRHLPVSALFLLQNPSKPTRVDLLPKNIHVHLSNPKGTDLVPDMEKFLARTGVDTVLTWEVPGCWEFPGLWQKKDIRWICVIHWDWFSKAQIAVWNSASTLVAPNRMCHRELLAQCNLKSVFLPVPIDTERLRFKERQKAESFVSTYGFGGFHNRRGIPQILEAWGAMSDPPKLVIRAQVYPGELKQGEASGSVIPKQIVVDLGNTPEPGDLYEAGDVAVQPSRYEGLGLSMLEAQARGVPVISVDAPPMNEIARELRVTVAQTETISIMGKPLMAYTPSADSIRKVVEGIRGKDIRSLSRDVRAKVERHFSWRALLSSWMDVLKG